MTMQVFYGRLFSEDDGGDGLMGRLQSLLKVSREKIIAVQGEADSWFVW